MAQSAYERVGQLVTEFNKAREANDMTRAIQMAKLAFRDASDELKKDNLIERDRTYFIEVVRSLSSFLENPRATVKAAAGKDSSDDSSEKIKNTDWFGAPIPDLGMKDIAGLKDVKDEFIVNVFAPMSPDYADIYRKYRGDENGIQVLLYGPPGTGKTHFVKCLAGEMKCKIAVVQIKDVMASLVGDGAKIISEIFAQAAEEERCIIFFDEIDAIAASREGEDSRHTKEQLTTLLTNMDGFTSKAKPGQLRIVIAATNRPWALDSAVKRGGRFDTQIYIPLPDADARKTLIRMALGINSKKKDAVRVPLAEDVTLDWLVERTQGYAGADIKAICRQAVGRPMKREILARVEGKIAPDMVTRSDFEEVFGKYINSITDEALMQFDAYRMNMEFDGEYIRVKCEQLILAYYRNHMRKKAGDNSKASYTKIEEFEETMFWNLYENGYIAEQFGKKYDLSFIEEIKADRNKK